MASRLWMQALVSGMRRKESFNWREQLVFEQNCLGTFCDPLTIFETPVSSWSRAIKGANHCLGAPPCRCVKPLRWGSSGLQRSPAVLTGDREDLSNKFGRFPNDWLYSLV